MTERKRASQGRAKESISGEKQSSEKGRSMCKQPSLATAKKTQPSALAKGLLFFFSPLFILHSYLISQRWAYMKCLFSISLGLEFLKWWYARACFEFYVVKVDVSVDRAFSVVCCGCYCYSWKLPSPPINSNQTAVGCLEAQMWKLSWALIIIVLL